MKLEQIEQWLSDQEAIQCALGHHENHKHPVVEEDDQEEVEETPAGEAEQ